MAVYKFRTMDAIFDALRKVAARLTNDCTLILSPDEFIQAFIRPEHVGPLKQVQGIVGMVGDESTVAKLNVPDGPFVYCSINFGYTEPPVILPKYIRDGFVGTAPSELKSRITAFVAERYRLGRMFGDAIDSLHYLNEHSGNAPAMAVFFPALPTLLAMSDPNPESTNAKRAKRLTEAKSFGTLATLPREVKMRMLEVSSLVMTASVLEDDKSSASLKESEAQLRVYNTVGDEDDFVWKALGQKKPASFV